MSDLTNSKFVGTWRPVSIEFLGYKGDFKTESRLELKADGTAIMSSPDEAEDDRKAFIWKETDYGVFLDGKHDFKLKYIDDVLYLKFLGVSIGYKKEN